MCSILYTTRNRDYGFLGPLIKKQLDRGGHSLGIVAKKGRKKRITEDQIKNVPKEEGTKAAIKLIKEFNKKINKENSGILMHLRKPSVGDNDIKNAHPIKIVKEYIIIQNGTCKLITNYAKIAYKDYDKERADTYYLGRHLLDSMTNKNLLQALATLKRISKHDTVGIVFMIDRKKGTVLMYTDGARDCYIKHTNNKIELISNYSPVDEQYKYTATGHILFKIEDGKIINKNISIVKTIKNSCTKKTYNASREWWNKNRYGYLNNTLELEKERYKPEPETKNTIINQYKMSKKKFKKMKKILDLPKQAITELVEVAGIHTALRTLKNVKRYCKIRPEMEDNIILTLSLLGRADIANIGEEDEWGLADILSEKYSEKLYKNVTNWLKDNF